MWLTDNIGFAVLPYNTLKAAMDFRAVFPFFGEEDGKDCIYHTLGQT